MKHVYKIMGLIALVVLLTGCVDKSNAQSQVNETVVTPSSIENRAIINSSLELVDTIQTKDIYGDRSRIEVVIDHKRNYLCYALIETNQYGSGADLQCFPNNK